MREQLSLPGWDELPRAGARPSSGLRQRYKLFIALFPPPVQARQIAQFAERWRRQHGLQARCLEAPRLHVTLQVVADFPQRPGSAMMDAAAAALAQVPAVAVDTCWDRLHSFPASGALVLRCDAASERNIAALRDGVQQALHRHGLEARPSTTPHMTLLYNRHHVPEHRVEPLRWTAIDFSLVLSHLGRHHHEHLGRWPLQAQRV